MNKAAEWFQRGVASQNAGNPFEAITCYAHAIAQRGTSPELHYNLAFALQTIGKDDEALAHYREAVRLNASFAEAHNNQGNIFHNREQLEQAQNSYELALQIKQDLVQARFNLGLVLKKRGRVTQAVEHFRAACRLAPGHVEAWSNLCDLLLALRRNEEWLEAFLEAERTLPTSSFILLTGLAACRYLGDFERERRYLARALDWQFAPHELDMASRLLRIIQYFDVGQEHLLSLYQRYNALASLGPRRDVPAMLPRRTRGDKLRLGYLSPDFRTHVMGLLMLEVFKRHDHGQFEIYAYSLADPLYDDAVTTSFKELSHRFVNIAGMSEQRSAQLIAEDDLDILVDLAGHSAYGRPLVLAYKPARVQITHLGYHGALGLDTVDYKLTDACADLPGNTDFLLEQLLFMEGSVFPFRHVEAARDHGYSRTTLGLDGKFVLGAFVNIMKLSPRCLSVWARVLDRIDNGVLAFSPLDEIEHPGFLRQVKAAGIAAERVVFIPYAKDESIARARYRLVDLVLDTFPYSGGDTTLAAIDMGVPVLTLVGPRHSERISYSILTNLGVKSTIAHDEDAFVSIAVRLATDVAFRENAMEEIQAGLKTSPLVDMVGYVRRLEHSYLRAVQEQGIPSTALGKLSADEFRSLFQEGLRLHQAGQLPEAEQLYRQVLDDQPEHAPTLYMLGMLLRAQGNVGQARYCLEQAIERAPHYADAWAALGRLDAGEGQHEAAVAAFASAIAARPGSPEILNDLGLALSHLGRRDEAISTLREAVKLKPSDSVSHFNLGVALQKTGELNQAVAEYSQAVMLQADHADACFNLGVALQDLGQREGAATYFGRVLELQPKNARAYRALGEAFLSAGKVELWLQNFQRFEQQCEPDLQLALYGLETCQYLGDRKKREAYLSGLLQQAYPARDLNDLLDGLSQLLFLLLYFDVDERQMLQLYQSYNLALQQAFPEPLALPEVRGPGKIRLGYLSADLRNHVMGKMIYQAVCRHDRSRFEIFFYSLSQVQDTWTEMFAAAGHKLVKLSGLDDVAAANLIARDELDILVDLSSHTQGASPGILRMKPARLQITHIASAGAVGCAGIDYKLTDHYADLPSAQAFLLETLLPMQGCVYPYRHIVPATDHGYDRTRLGLPANALTLAAFVTLLKLSTRCLSIWREVLERLPMAYLVFSPLSVEARPYYLKRISEAGIDAARIVFIPADGDESVNQARYSLIDISLDPLPYGGANGTLEALDMGVPVVTLCGKRHGERSSFSMLKNLGVTETIAQTGQEYVAIVERLATDRKFCDAVREKIRSGLVQSELVDMDGHTRKLEAAYLRALRDKGVSGFGSAMG